MPQLRILDSVANCLRDGVLALLDPQRIRHREAASTRIASPGVCIVVRTRQGFETIIELSTANEDRLSKP